MKTDLTFDVYAPGGNITALVEAPVSANHRAEIAQAIMASSYDIEQVGFLEEAEGHAFALHMMGDELCVNAAQVCAHRYRGADDFTFLLSGSPDPVRAHRGEDGTTLYFSQGLVRNVERVTNGTLVDLTGIRYLVSEIPVSEDAILGLLDIYADPAFPADGYVHVEHTDAGVLITPYVRVSATKTFRKESACGSGSIAVALALGAPMLTVIQPSGSSVLVGQTEDGITFSGPVGEREERTVSLVLPQ